MHISLDSALGRQRRLNSVGESVFQIAPDAAAGYSLRSLTGGDPSVVRVRRESDNGERDFRSSEINSGAMVRWVNEQITPPLDLRELTATGRDGPIIEAAAAYSLRNLSDSYTGSVVEVRRSSDGNTQSFTAAEVTDGTLTTWVNTPYTFYVSNFSSGTDGWQGSNTSVTGNIDEGADGAGQPPSDNWIRLVAGDRLSLRNNNPVDNSINSLGGGTYNVIADYYVPSNVSNHKIIAFPAGIQSAGRNLTVGSGTVTYTISLSDSQAADLSDLRIGSTGNYTTGTKLYFKNIRIQKSDANGTVSKWYDQSTTSGVPNANHAVQTDAAKQPKIVSGGSLVTGGFTFDGDDFFNLTSSISQGGSFSYFFALDNLIAIPRTLIGRTGGSTPRVRLESSNIEIKSSSNAEINYSTSAWTGNSGQSLVSFNRNGSNLTSAYRDGVEIGTAGSISGSLTHDRLFKLNDTNAAGFNGRCQEVIIYNTDQTDNRTALEANIGEVYGIAGIPAYDNTVNGFVETWYDQSGNGNNATQLTAGNQPKIVSGGTLLLRNGKPTVDLYNNSSLATGAFTDGSAQSSFSVINNQAANSTRKLFYNKTEYPNKGVALNYRGDQTAGQYDFVSLDGDTDSLLYNNTSSPLYALFSTFINSSKNLFINGSSAASSSDSFVADDGTLVMGSASFGTGFDIQEIIIYNSDQSANRLAIEANINNQYDIY